MQEQYRVTNIAGEEETGAEFLRILSETMPTKDAKQSMPTLEDYDKDTHLTYRIVAMVYRIIHYGATDNGKSKEALIDSFPLENGIRRKRKQRGLRHAVS